MTNDPLELWVRQVRRTKEYKARQAQIAAHAALTKRPGEIDAVLKSTETDAAFVAQFGDRARRLVQQLLFCETQKAIAEERRAKPKRPPEEPKW